MRDILYDLDQNGIATLTLNRPDKHNAFDDILIKGLLRQLEELERDPQVKLLQLTAAGKSFSAGADLHWMRRMAAYTHEENLEDARVLSQLLKKLKYFSKPTIVSVQGPVYGGGVGLVTCCDIAVASTEAKFCLSEVKVGLIPAVISPYIISAIGERAMRYYALTAEVMDADEALRLGLVTQLTLPQELPIITQELSEKILSYSPQAVIATKQLINRVASIPYDTHHEEKNAQALADIRTSEEGKAGLKKFLDKKDKL